MCVCVCGHRLVAVHQVAWKSTSIDFQTVPFSGAVRALARCTALRSLINFRHTHTQRHRKKLVRQCAPLSHTFFAPLMLALFAIKRVSIKSPIISLFFHTSYTLQSGQVYTVTLRCRLSVESDSTIASFSGDAVSMRSSCNVHFNG